MENQSQFESFELQLNETAIQYLKESAKWSLFLAIMGFIGIGFMLLAAIVMGTMMSSALGAATPIAGMGGMLSGVYAVMAILYFFPIYYLYKYATDMKTALNSRNNDLLTSALGYLKSHHKFLGISIIVVISLYILMIIGFVAFGMSSMMG
jgi:Family of unknown function (DUF5362)